MPIPILLIAAGVAITASALAWIMNAMTEEEKRKHAKINSKIKNYDNKYKKLVEEHSGNIKELEQNIYIELSRDFKSQIAFFRKEKSSIKDDLFKVKKLIEEQLSQESISPYVKKALLFEKNRVDDAYLRLEAYWNYLIWFENELEKLEQSENFIKILDMGSPKPLLPNDYLYIGKLAKIQKDELHKNNYGQGLELAYYKIGGRYSDKLERENFNEYKNNKINEVPVFIDNYYYPKNVYYCSVAKAEIWLSILSGERIKCKIRIKERQNESNIKIDYKGIRGILPRENKQFALKQYREDDPVELKVIENDFLLKEILFTEKVDFILNNRLSNEIFILYNEKVKIEIDNLEEQFNKFNLYIIEFDYVEKVISFQISDIVINCAVLDDHLLIKSIENDKPTSYFSIDPPFEFTLIPQKSFDPELFIDTQRSFRDFLTFASREFQYKEYSKSSNYKDFEFFRKWNQIIDYQIQMNSYEEYSFNYEKIELECSTIKKINKLKIELSDFDSFLKILEKNKVHNNRNIIISSECKINALSSYKYLDIGVVDDLVEKQSLLVVKIEISPEKLEISNNKKVTIKIPTFQSALRKQRSALENFSKGKIVNKDLKRTLISPSICEQTIDSKWESILESGLSFKDNLLTENQKETITSILKEKNLFLVQGPPGTGKTTIIKEIAYQYLIHFPYAKILIVSQQNVAVDNALSKIYDENKSLFDSLEKSFVRIAPNEDKVSTNLKRFIIEAWFKDYKDSVAKNFSNLIYNNSQLQKCCNDWWNLINKTELREVDSQVLEVLINSHNIIGATCVGLANKSIGLDLVEFDIAIIDEAGRATPPELLIPMLRAKKVVLFGDHFQLPPQYDRKLLAFMEEDNEDKLFYFDKEFLEKSYFENLYLDFPDSNKSILTDQFRMPKEIGVLISNLFYHKKLKNGKIKSSENFYDEKHTIRWIDVIGTQRIDNKSSYNLEEIEKICVLIKDINKKLKVEKSLAVITPYSAQKKKLKLKINENNFDKFKSLKIDTIDSFQGEEADIVIYSTVRTKGNLSFLIDRKRLNVAISRTKENLIFVGNKNYLRSAKVSGKVNLFNEIIRYIEKLS